ncbi:hypothetical protein [Cryobacterium sp. Hb1]|uniref:variant leucine-rich repeat-containing protein n=1 Tax=Cryobacterium sp. Hb1 TaxID=1259147 RepID=UPI00106D9974|nr:hypothetical protein [Cryobacterium sp. Hb1]TFD71904.1 hypothetical protein E3T38_03770 [Cryobacterium sp. Hb1]
MLIIGTAGMSVLLVIANLIGSGASTGATGLNIGATIVLSIIIVVAIIARTTLRSTPAGSQWLALGLTGLITGLITVLGIVFVVLRGQTITDGNLSKPYSWLFHGAEYASFSLVILSTAAMLSLALAFGLPALVFYALTVPASVRSYFTQYGPVRAQAQAAYTGYAAAPVAAPITPTDATAPVVPATAPQMPVAVPVSPPPPRTAPPAPPAPVAVPVAVIIAAPSAASLAAADPNTSAAKFYDLAQNHPEVWPQLAGNRSAYPDLLAWLAQSPDPLVQQALRARGL